jgi:hypothetical protein
MNSRQRVDVLRVLLVVHDPEPVGGTEEPLARIVVELVEEFW